MALRTNAVSNSPACSSIVSPRRRFDAAADAAGIDTGTWRAETVANASLDVDQTEALRLFKQLTADASRSDRHAAKSARICGIANVRWVEGHGWRLRRRTARVSRLRRPVD